MTAEGQLNNRGGGGTNRAREVKKKKLSSFVSGGLGGAISARVGSQFRVPHVGLIPPVCWVLIAAKSITGELWMKHSSRTYTRLKIFCE